MVSLGPSPLSSSRGAPLESFHLFPTLPTELRQLIWTHAFANLTTERLIVLQDPISTEFSDTERALFRPYPDSDFDDRVPLLHACSESRSMLVSNGHRFSLPTPSYHFIEPTKRSIERFLTQQGFARLATTNVPRLLEAALDFYNSHPEEAAKHPWILRLGAPLPRYKPSPWLDREEDFLLIPFARDSEPYHSTIPGWNHCGTLAAAGVKKLAIEMSRADWDHWTHINHAIFPEKIWSQNLKSGEVEWERYQSVREIALWTREGCEVCWFSVDSQGLLGPDEWSFCLDIENQRFKERFGERWSNITWRIVFGKATVREEGKAEREKNVCEMLRDWRPHSAGWWSSKQLLVRKVPEASLGDAWRGLVERAGMGIPLALVDLRAVRGAVDGTYYGPSF